MKPVLALAVCVAASCAPATLNRGASPLAAAVSQTAIDGIVDDDAEIREYVLRNGSGMVVRFLNHGGVITAIEAEDRSGQSANVVLGYGSESEYRRFNGKNLFGALVGRYAGRIGDARFVLDGRQIHLEPNLAGNALHGGREPGLSFKVWHVRPFRRGDVVGAVLQLTDPAGAQRFPGELDLQVTYSLMPDNSFRIDYAATTTEPTVLNLTNHTYFNLAGADSGSVEHHLLRIFGSRYVATDEEDIPTGALPSVALTPLDFRHPHRLSERIDDSSSLLAGHRGGFNHSWMLDKPEGRLARAATLTDPASGRTLTIETTEPSLHAYTGEYFDGEDVSPSGVPIHPRDGIALEVQHLSDSPNRPDFPSTELRPGQVYRATTIWRFGIER